MMKVEQLPARSDGEGRRPTPPTIYGLRRIGTGRCPRRLVGRGHRTGECGCWCRTRLNDHGATWADEQGRTAVVWQPYDADGVELAAVIRQAAADGLDVMVTGASPHYPGGTFAIVFSAADAYLIGHKS